MNALPEPFYGRLAAILRPSAFQAGGHAITICFSMLFILLSKGIHCTPEIDSTSEFSPECRWSSTLKTWRTRNPEGGDGLQQLPTRISVRRIAATVASDCAL